MFRIRFSFIVVLCCALLAGCSGSGSSAGSDTGSSSMRANLGTSSRDHLTRTSEEALLTRYGYRLQRRVDTTEDIRLETEWKDLSATRDEQAQGYSFARVRITITARPRSRSGGGARTYSARLVAECQVRRVDGVDWMDMPISPERRIYLDEIVDYLENEFKGGVR